MMRPMLPIADDDDLLTPLPIVTPRLELTTFTLRAMRATLAADLATAAREIDAEVPADLRERLGELFEMRSIQVLTDPPSLVWLARAMVMVDPATGRRRMVGSVGFHAPPSGDPPHVEIGYHVEPDFRRRGLATEAVRAMLDWARGAGDPPLPGHGRRRRMPPRWPRRRCSASGRSACTGTRSTARSSSSRRSGRGRPRPAERGRIGPLAACEDAPVTEPERPALDPRWSIDTLAVHAGQEPDELTGAVAPPIYQTATYAQDGVGRPRGGYEYARSQNPTRERLERAVAALEGGAHGIAFASGSATTAAIAELAGPGDEIVVGDDVYGGTFRYLERVHRAKGIDARYVDLAAGPDVAVGGAHRPDAPRLVRDRRPTRCSRSWTSRAIAADRPATSAPRAGRGRCIVVDNTFASPALQRPLELGADIVFHSATKYLSGPLGHGPRRRRDARRRRWPSGSASSRTRWAPCPGRSTASSSCAACGRSRCGSSATRPTRRPSRGSWPAATTSSGCRYPGLADGPHAHPRAGCGAAARCARAAAWSRSCRRRAAARATRPRARRSRSARRRGSSRWPSRSAASSR